MKTWIILVLFVLLSINSNGEIVYSNNFDTASSLSGLIVDPGEGEVSIESGQLKLVGELFNYKGAYVSIHSSQFASPYTGKLSDISGKLMWSFNLSNMDDPAGGSNNGFEICLVNSKSSPYDSSQYSYEMNGGILVANRMIFYRASHTWSPYGNDSEKLIDIPSSQGLAPLPVKGSFRIEYIPSTGKWEWYVEYGSSYVDPRGVSTLLGYAYDNKYANDNMPYLTLHGKNSGAVYIDNLTVEIVGAASPPVADANGPYSIYAGDTLTLDASGSTDDENDITSYVWDLNDDGVFETDAGTQAVFDVSYAYIESLGLLVGVDYNIHLKVTDGDEQDDTDATTLTIEPRPALVIAVDIKPTSCPNPLNVKSKGVLPVAILGTDSFDVATIVISSLRLGGVAPLRDSYEDVAAPAFDIADCDCVEDGPDGFVDLTLKFETQEIVQTLGEVEKDDVVTLELTGVLFDETPIEGADCIIIRGRRKPFNRGDINKDGVINAADFAIFAQDWLQSSIVDD